MPTNGRRHLRRSLSLAAGLAMMALAAAPGGAAHAGEAAAVWVPVAPAGAAANGPVVLVPFSQTLRVPEPGAGPMPWVPEYLAPRAGTAGPEAAAQRLRNLPRRDDFGLVGSGYDLPGEAEPAAPAATLFDVVREVEWRRATAERLREKPGFRRP